MGRGGSKAGKGRGGSGKKGGLIQAIKEGKQIGERLGTQAGNKAANMR